MFPGSRKALRMAQDRISTLEEGVDTLEREVRTLGTAIEALNADVSLQWEKVNRAVGRLAKRDVTEARATETGPDGSPSEDELNEIIRRGEIPSWPTHF